MSSGDWPAFIGPAPSPEKGYINTSTLRTAPQGSRRVSTESPRSQRRLELTEIVYTSGLPRRRGTDDRSPSLDRVRPRARRGEREPEGHTDLRSGSSGGKVVLMDQVATRSRTLRVDSQIGGP